jgi:hypothetical protein
MKTVTMLEFRKNAKGVLHRIAKGERILLLAFSPCGTRATNTTNLDEACPEAAREIGKSARL